MRRRSRAIMGKGHPLPLLPLLLLVLLGAATSVTASNCTVATVDGVVTIAACDCADGAASLDVSNQGVATIDPAVWTTTGGCAAAVSSLYLNWNQVTRLQTSQFDGLSALTALYLQNNHLSSIADLAFHGLSALRELALDHNDLATVSATMFVDLARLTSLSLNHNELTSLFTDTFKFLTSLTTLNLQYNVLQNIEPGTFRGLARLNTLNLQNNQLAAISADAFDGLTALSALRLDNNQLFALNIDTFAAVSSLTVLYLQNNQLSGIDAEAFSTLPALRNLYLYGNPQLASCRYISLTTNAISGKCNVCPVGTHYSGLDVSTACYSCPSGHGDSTACTACPAGSYGSVTGATACYKCAAGTYAATSGATSAASCTSCPVGKFSLAGQSTCSTCRAGTYGRTAGASGCAACPAGTYGSVAGAFNCTTCPRGTFSSLAGATSCTPAPVGTFVDTEGATDAQDCPMYTSTEAPGSTACTLCLRPANCPGGPVCSDGATGPLCSSCMPNFFDQEGVCTECPSFAWVPIAVGILLLLALVGLVQFRLWTSRTSDVLRTVGNFVQLVTLQLSFTVPWPKFARHFGGWTVAAFGRMGIMYSPECTVSVNWSGAMVTMLIGAVLILLVPIALFPISRWRARSKQVQAVAVQLAHAATTTPATAAPTIVANQLVAEGQSAMLSDDNHESRATQAAADQTRTETALADDGTFDFYALACASLEAWCTMAMIVYLPLLQTLLQPLDCTTTHSGVWLRADSSVACDTWGMRLSQLLAGMGAAILILVVPGAVFWTVGRVDGNERVRWSLLGRTLQPLHSTCKSNFRYMEVVSLWRKVAAVFLLLLTDGKTQLGGQLLLCILFLMVLYRQPWLSIPLVWRGRVIFSNALNRMAFMTCLGEFVILVCGLAALVWPSSSVFAGIVFIGIVVVVIALLSAVFFVLTVEQWGVSRRSFAELEVRARELAAQEDGQQLVGLALTYRQELEVQLMQVDSELRNLKALPDDMSTLALAYGLGQPMVERREAVVKLLTDPRGSSRLLALSEAWKPRLAVSMAQVWNKLINDPVDRAGVHALVEKVVVESRQALQELTHLRDELVSSVVWADQALPVIDAIRAMRISVGQASLLECNGVEHAFCCLTRPTPVDPRLTGWLDAVDAVLDTESVKVVHLSTMEALRADGMRLMGLAPRYRNMAAVIEIDRRLEALIAATTPCVAVVSGETAIMEDDAIYCAVPAADDGNDDDNNQSGGGSGTGISGGASGEAPDIASPVIHRKDFEKVPDVAEALPAYEDGNQQPTTPRSVSEPPAEQPVADAPDLPVPQPLKQSLPARFATDKSADAKADVATVRRNADISAPPSPAPHWWR